MKTADIRTHRLSNGLWLLGELYPERQSAAIGFFTRTGSRDETDAESGVSHFLEHMMFKGTATRNALDITFQLGNIGAQANAFTTEENTVYYATVLPEYFPQMQELLSDMLRPSLVREEFVTEKKVILEEIALYQDRPQFYLFEKALKDFYGAHPAGNSVLGTAESVGALSREQMADYFARRYVPSNMALVACGKFDWLRFVEDAERYCSEWTDQSAPRTITEPENRSITCTYKRKKLNQSHVVFVSPGASAQDLHRYPLALLSMILGDSSSSKLYWELVDKGLVEGAGAENDERDGTGVFMAYASTEPGRLAEVEGIVEQVLSRPLDFTDGELERAKTKLTTRIVLQGELPIGRLMALGSEWLYRGVTESLPETLEAVSAVTRASIEEALRVHGRLSNWSRFRLVPEV